MLETEIHVYSIRKFLKLKNISFYISKKVEDT